MISPRRKSQFAVARTLIVLLNCSVGLAGDRDNTTVPATVPHDHSDVLAMSRRRSTNDYDLRRTQRSRLDRDASIKAQPFELLQEALKRYECDIQDYTCLFTKQERIDGKLRKATTTHVLFREAPFSVLMTPQGKAKTVKRALYIEGRHQDRDGREMMIVEPAGWRRVLTSKASIAVDDKRILKKNRNTIDKFGFKRALERLQRVNRRAQSEGVLDLRFAGKGNVGGRPTLVIERYLPYDPATNHYPDAKAVIHLDEELLLPVAVNCYADNEEQQLIKRYQITRLSVNEGLDDDSFEF